MHIEPQPCAYWKNIAAVAAAESVLSLHYSFLHCVTSWNTSHNTTTTTTKSPYERAPPQIAYWFPELKNVPYWIGTLSQNFALRCHFSSKEKISKKLDWRLGRRRKIIRRAMEREREKMLKRLLLCVLPKYTPPSIPSPARLKCK
jgi:hypothetical protein